MVPIFKKPKLDKVLLDLKKLKKAHDDKQQVLNAHFYLMNELIIINGEDKRSFSSKYLHFHLPNLFYL